MPLDLRPLRPGDEIAWSNTPDDTGFTAIYKDGDKVEHRIYERTGQLSYNAAHVAAMMIARTHGHAVREDPSRGRDGRATFLVKR